MGKATYRCRCVFWLRLRLRRCGGGTIFGPLSHSMSPYAWRIRSPLPFMPAADASSLDSSVVPTFEVAQALLGLLGPLFFLFGGLWSPPPQMAAGARWFCYIDPITYAFKALIPQQFYSGSDGPGAQSVLLSGPTPPCSPPTTASLRISR